MASIHRLLPFALVVSVMAPSVASACSAPYFELAEPNPSLVDDVLPTAIGGAVEVSIKRGQGPNCDDDGICEISSCDDIGAITLVFDAPTDDQTEPGQMAFVIEVVEGEPVGVPEGAFRTGEANRIQLLWGDGSTHEQEPIDFTIVIRAVDEAGNIGPASDLIEISHPGVEAEPEPEPEPEQDLDSESSQGCRMGGTGSGAWLLLLPLWGLLRRRGAITRGVRQ
jgi:hypothetical protein